MKKLEWPGIATVVGILLILTISFAIAREPNFRLADWQPFLAAMVALVGGTLAYKSAMAKVDFDRQAAAKKDHREALKILFKIEYAARILATDAFARKQPFKDWASWRYPITVEKKDIKITVPSEISQAWDQLDLFDAKIVEMLVKIRLLDARIQAIMAELPDDQPLQLTLPRTDEVHQMDFALNDMHQVSREVAAAISEQIATMRSYSGLGRDSSL
jgi:hypothetical protein